MKKKSNNKIGKKSNLVPIYLQALLSVVTIILFIVYLINKDTAGLLQIGLGLTLIVTGFNNYKVYHRPLLTIAYFVVGIILLVLAVITIMGI